PPSKSFREKMMFSLKSASLMSKAAATAGLGAKNAIAAIASHDESRRFILTSPFGFGSGLARQVPSSYSLTRVAPSEPEHASNRQTSAYRIPMQETGIYLR